MISHSGQHFLIVILLSLCFTITHACTNIVLKSKDNSVLVGRTLEFGPDLESVFYLKGRGEHFKNMTESGKETLHWRGKHGYIYANGFGLDLPLDGMNEKGLSIAYLYLPGYTQYNHLPKKLSSSQKAISFMNLPHWVLSQYQRVSDVKKALPRLIVYKQNIKLKAAPNVSFEVHMVITDETGDSIIVEWLNGKTHIYQDTGGVLTNSPPFEWQENNLKNYLGLSPYSPNPISISGITYSVNGQGSGWLGLPGDTSPPSRFVKMASMLQTAKQPNNAEGALVLTQHILGNVFIPKGFVRDKHKTGEDTYETTQWSVFKDLTNRKIYFSSYDYPLLQSIDLNKIDFSRSVKDFKLPLSHRSAQSIDATEALLGHSS